MHALAGFPKALLVDHKSVFVSCEFKYLCASNEIQIRATGVESHQSLGAVETYHCSVRRVYEKIRFMNTIVPHKVALGAAVHAINSAAGPKGLVPALLVFGMIPKIPSPATAPFRDNSERLRILSDARKEYEAIVAKTRVQLGLRTRPPNSSRQTHKAGDLVYVYREKQRI